MHTLKSRQPSVKEEMEPHLWQPSVICYQSYIICVSKVRWTLHLMAITSVSHARGRPLERSSWKGRVPVVEVTCDDRWSPNCIQLDTTMFDPRLPMASDNDNSAYWRLLNLNPITKKWLHILPPVLLRINTEYHTIFFHFVSCVFLRSFSY